MSAVGMYHVKIPDALFGFNEYSIWLKQQNDMKDYCKNESKEYWGISTDNKFCFNTEEDLTNFKIHFGLL